MIAGFVLAAATAPNAPVTLQAPKPTLPDGELVLLGSDRQRFVFLDRSRTVHDASKVSVSVLIILATPMVDPQGARFKFVVGDGLIRCDLRTWTSARQRVFDEAGDYLLTGGPRPELKIQPTTPFDLVAGYVCDKVPVPAGNYVVGWRTALGILSRKDLTPYTPHRVAPKP
jgi:hypothetical protein